MSHQIGRKNKSREKVQRGQKTRPALLLLREIKKKKPMWVYEFPSGCVPFLIFQKAYRDRGHKP
jgi:hypothetical protein